MRVMHALKRPLILETDMDRTVHLPLLRIKLCGKDKLPRDFAFEGDVELIARWGRESLGDFRVRVYPMQPTSGVKKTSRHRIFIACASCKRWIPAGRWQQHLKGKTHEEPRIS